MIPLLCCYRLTSLMPYDEESVWQFVQQHKGYLNIRGDCIDFWIPEQYQSLLVLKYTLLASRPDLDYV